MISDERSVVVPISIIDLGLGHNSYLANSYNQLLQFAILNSMSKPNRCHAPDLADETHRTSLGSQTSSTNQITLSRHLTMKLCGWRYEPRVIQRVGGSRSKR